MTMIPVAGPDGRFSAGQLPGSLATLPTPGRVRKLDEGFHPGGQGNNVYTLMSVDTRANGPHLVGNMGKGSDIIDFTTGEEMDVFSALGPLPMLAPDSYGAGCVWTRPDGRRCMYMGGWVKRPAIVGATNNHTNKYSWVAEFFLDDPVEPIKFSQWILLDKAQAPNSWQSEVSHLIATPHGVLIFRGDAAVGSSSADLKHGLYLYNGLNNGTPYTVTTDPSVPDITITANVRRISNHTVVKGGIYADQLLVQHNYDTDVLVYDILTDVTLNTTTGTTKSPFSYVDVPVRTGGTKTIDIVLKSEFSKLSGVLFAGADDGYFLGDPRVANDCVFMPLLISPSSAAAISRTLGYRANVVQVGGGIVTGVSPDMGGLRTDLPQGFLLYLGMSGTAKILDVGGAFGAAAVHGDRLFYGRANLGHNDTYENYRGNDVELASLPIESLLNSPPPSFTERISYTSYNPTTSGVGGLLGGYPTLGYQRGLLNLLPSVDGTLTIIGYSVSKGGALTNAQRVIETIECTAGVPVIRDLSKGTEDGGPYLGGDILGFKFSAAGSLVGSVSFA